MPYRALTDKSCPLHFRGKCTDLQLQQQNDAGMIAVVVCCLDYCCNTLCYKTGHALKAGGVDVPRTIIFTSMVCILAGVHVIQL